MFGAATSAVPADQQGVASGVASTTQQIGGAVGLALFVAVANAGTGGLTGPALTAATADGLHDVMLGSAAGIALTALAALGFTPTSSARPAPATSPVAEPLETTAP